MITGFNRDAKILQQIFLGQLDSYMQKLKCNI